MPFLRGLLRLLLLASPMVVLGFQATPTATTRIRSTQQKSASTATTSTSLHASALLGRFRKKRKVDQTGEVSVGDILKDMDVEKLVFQENGECELETTNIRDVLGTGRSVLVGMPGAFTPTCSKDHLPGYIKNSDKLKSLGVDTIAVVTTNDRFVNEEWMQASGAVNQDSSITMVCDGDGDLVKSLGLAEDMGFGMGVRSKRFALVTDNGRVTVLLTDPGMDECSSTSAETLIQTLTPEGQGLGDGEINPAVLGGAAALIALALAAQLTMGGGGGDSTTRTMLAAPATKTHVEKTTKTSPFQSRQPETGFRLLKEYGDKQ